MGRPLNATQLQFHHVNVLLRTLKQMQQFNKNTTNLSTQLPLSW